MDLEKYTTYKKSLKRLKEAYLRAKQSDKDDYPFFRDSTIQRFEFTVEVFWRNIKSFLKEVEGIECRSPKSCIREFYSTGYLAEEDAAIFLQMIDDRNLTSHTYRESIADQLFLKIKTYIEKLEEALSDLQGYLKE